MVRAPCCEKIGLKRGQWTQDEDDILTDYINKHGHGRWRSLPKHAGLLRCGKSCRLRWKNYLRPDIKRGPFTPEEEKLVIQLHAILGNRWAAIAAQLPGRTDNEIKNLWNTQLRKQLTSMGIDPQTHQPVHPEGSLKRPTASSSTRHMAQWETARLEAEARLSTQSFSPSLLTSPDKATSNDYFLRVWHSEVGDSFRKGKPVCYSPVSQASVSNYKTTEMVTKLDHEPDTGFSCVTMKDDCITFNPVVTNPSSPSEMEDSPDPILQFFDFHGHDDMIFLEA